MAIYTTLAYAKSRGGMSKKKKDRKRQRKIKRQQRKFDNLLEEVTAKLLEDMTWQEMFGVSEWQ